MTDNTNPGNFANRPAEEVKEIASKGGKASGTSGGSSSSGGSSDGGVPLSPLQLCWGRHWVRL